MTLTSPPNQGDFLLFIRNNMGISATVLPDNSPVIPVALAVALEIVNLSINAASPLMYNLAVYNLGGDNIINYAPDITDAPPVPGSDPPAPYFAWARQRFNIAGYVSGVVQTSSDEGTSVGLVVQEAAKNFTLSDLQNLKTPWGRQYLAIAQRYGALWGLS